ncbi:hypothetical protein DTO027B5_8561 [Paecilomyces variotii]|nr:hypothetical protein DTO027B3_5752 [Paecilomyces variotii]KAJ9328918.1 hypothetical protein DTO027B5_8561 [Paecilomyces variotii]
MFQNVPLSIGRKRVFDSVFSPASLDHATAPHLTTPLLNLLVADQSFDSATEIASPSQDYRLSSRDEAAWDRAWNAATAFLSVPDRGFASLEASDEMDETEFLKQWNRYDPPSKQTSEALAYLLKTSPLRKGPQAGAEEHDLIEWYGNEIRRHFLVNFRGSLVQLLKGPVQEGLLHQILRYCLLMRRIYFTHLVDYVLPLVDASQQEAVFLRIQRIFHAIVAFSLPSAPISSLLAAELAKEAYVILGIDTASADDLGEEDLDEEDQDAMERDDTEVDIKHTTSYRAWRMEASEEARAHMLIEGETEQAAAARERLLPLLADLQTVGLGGDRAQKVFAGVMSNMMTEFIKEAYSGQWEAPSLVIQHLRLWVENVYARLAVEILAILNVSDGRPKPQGHLDVRLGDVEKWQEIAVARLGALRTSELFDVIVEWPTSSGAIEDLKHFAVSPASRSHITNSFVAMLNQRLLQPGASTVEILQLYISIIRAFNLLDPRGVILDRVARPIRRYLRDREDAVKVIVNGLLADPVDADGQPSASNSDTLAELATELTKAREASLRPDMGELDWDDMNWMPDPIDAAPDYKKSKNSDVIGSLISLFDSKEMFVRELQNMLADRLIKKRADFEQETSVLELLKVRFGDSALQACEVMLRDIFDSKRVDAVVRNDQKLARRQPSPRHASPGKKPAVVKDVPQLHAKILSRFFWPNLQEQAFKIPDEIVSLQERYTAGFETLKQSRKLTWLNGLGQVTVELDLEDRVFTDEVTTWQATVIYAFQSEDETKSSTKSVAELSQQLEMSASLVRSACLFWVSKRILVETQRDTFRVLEVLPSEEENEAMGVSETDNGEDGTAGAAAAADAAAAAAAKETADAAASEKMKLYWQFIVGMLTNQGAMPLQRIVMMLQIAVPGGFPFSNEELREFLAGMVTQKKLEIVSGGNYKIISH